MYSLHFLTFLSILVASAPTDNGGNTGTTLPMTRKASKFNSFQRAVRSSAFSVAKYSPATLSFDSQPDPSSSTQLFSIHNIIDKFLSFFHHHNQQQHTPTPISPNTPGGADNNALLNKDNELFVVPVTLGSGQVFSLDLDTGSSDTWFRGPKCRSPKDTSCFGSKVKLGDPTFKMTSFSFQTTYGSGAVIGDIIIAPVAIGNSRVTIPVGISTAEKGFGVGSSDGLMGIFVNFSFVRTCF